MNSPILDAPRHNKHNAYIHTRNLTIIILYLFVSVTLVAGEQHPAPDPFSVNSYDAAQAVWMIRRAGLLMVQRPGQRRPEIRSLSHPRAVESVHIGTDENAISPVHRERFDIVIDGEPLDWEHTFIQFGGQMVNMMALFSYRNQALPPGLQRYVLAE